MSGIKVNSAVGPNLRRVQGLIVALVPVNEQKLPVDQRRGSEDQRHADAISDRAYYYIVDDHEVQGLVTDTTFSARQGRYGHLGLACPESKRMYAVDHRGCETNIHGVCGIRVVCRLNTYRSAENVECESARRNDGGNVG